MAFHPSVRALITRRDDGMCCLCGRPATNIHHRTPRGAGGSKARLWVDQPANALSLCGQGNVSGCHGWIESHRAEAVERGWIVPRNRLVLPAEVPYYSPFVRSWFLLDDAGGRTEVEAP